MDEGSLNPMAGEVAFDNDMSHGCRPRTPTGKRQRRDVTRNWPSSLWVILKVLGLFHHRRLIGSRRCYLCEARSRVSRLDLLRGSDPECGCVESGVELNLDHLSLAYGSDSGDEGPTGYPSRLTGQLDDRVCEACSAQWWNVYGVSVVYTEEDIGVAHWNHRGSVVLSLTILLLEVGVLSFNAGYPLYLTWGRSDQILKLMTATALAFGLSVHPMLALVASIKGLFHDGIANSFAWASVLNVRYLIKRGQFLNLPRKGLPGKPFLLICIAFPLAVMNYRSFIFFRLGSCEVSFFTLTTSLVGIIFMETWSLSVYILYFVRVSFQRQMNLQLARVKEKVEAMERRAILFAVAADFFCFKQLVEMYAALIFPCACFAIVANISFDYILGADRHDGMEEAAEFAAEFNFAILAWIEIGTGFILYLLALGGLQVGYIWEKFLLNLLHLEGEGGCGGDFWTGLFRDLKHFDKRSKLLLTSIICSVIGIYAGIGISDQKLFDPAVSCANGTALGFF